MIGSDFETYKLTSQTTQILIPSLILQSITETIKTYCNSQGIEIYFGYFNLLITIIFSPLCYYLTIEKQLGLVGFVLYKYSVDLVNFLFSFGIYKKLTHEKSRDLTFDLYPDDQNQEMKSYLRDCFKFLLSFYFEIFGILCCVVLAILQEDIYNLTAFIQFLNLFSVVYCVGIGFSLVVRSRINFLFGKEKFKTAKNFFWWFWRTLVFYGVLVGFVVFWCFGRWIAWFYTHDEVTAVILGRMIKLFGFVYWCEISLMSSMTVLRSLGKVNFLIFFQGIFSIGTNLAVSYYLGVRKRIGSLAYVIGTCSGILLVGIFNVFLILCAEWKSDKEESEEEEEAIELDECDEFSFRMSVSVVDVSGSSDDEIFLPV